MKKKERCGYCGTSEKNYSKPFCKKCSEEIDIEHFGAYRVGMTSEEIRNYLAIRANTHKTADLLKKFNRIAGVNTVGVGPQGQSLMYRWDVKRFADVALGVTRGTYFD